MKRLWRRVRELFEVKIIKVKSHTGIVGNDEADELALHAAQI